MSAHRPASPPGAAPAPGATPTPRRGATAPTPTRRRRATRQAGPAALLLAPFFVLFATTLAAPILYATWLSLFSQQRSGLGFGNAEQVFVGLANYGRALLSPDFQGGFVVIALYCVLYIPIMGLSALGLALLLDSALARAKRFFQLALFLPHAVPGIIAAIIWAYLYTPGLSPVLKLLAEGGFEIQILSTTYVVPAIVNIALWEWTGYNVIIFYTALQAIDRSIIEAASIDGSSGWTTAWRIKVPMIYGSIVVVLLFTIIGSLQLFTEPVILSQSTAAVTKSFTPNMFAYSAAFVRNDFGLAAAASVILALVAAALSWVVTRSTRKKDA
jgi:multiple sugar transport system permease protein